MDSAKKLSRNYQARVPPAEVPWLQGAEKSEFGTGLIDPVAIAIRGGRMKRNGIAIGKTSFPLIGRRLPVATDSRPGSSLQSWLEWPIRDDYQVPIVDEQEGEQLIAGILSAVTEALSRCEGSRHAWTRRHLRRAIVLIGGMDEEMAQVILDQEGV